MTDVVESSGTGRSVGVGLASVVTLASDGGGPPSSSFVALF